MSSNSSPSNNFTDKVMKDVKKRPRKIGLWNTVYFLPIALAVGVLLTPSARMAILNTADTQHSAVNSVQQDVDEIQSMMQTVETFPDNDLYNIEYASSR